MIKWPMPKLYTARPLRLPAKTKYTQHRMMDAAACTQERHEMSRGQ
jgi:hypothetical protein